MQQMICSESENLRKKLIRDMTKERSGLRAYIRNCKDEISCREAQEKINKLSKRIENIKFEIKQRMISEEINQFQDFWNELAPTAKLELLDSIIDRIDVYPDRIWTHLKDEYTELEQELSAQLRTSGLLSHTKRKDNHLILATPINIKTCSGQTHIEIVGISYENNRHSLLRAIALSWKWSDMLFSGEVANIPQLAKTVRLSEAYVTRIVSLFNLAPSIVEDILNGNIPDGLSLAQLTEGLPDSWQEQCKKLGFSFRQMKI